VRGYALRRCDPATADDVVSEVFVVACRRLDDVSGDDALPWLLACARLALANQARSGRRQAALSDRLAGGLPPTTQQAPRSADRGLARALAALGERDREVLMLVAWEGLEPAGAARGAAATGLLTGDPVKPPHGSTFSSPTRGVGVPVKGSERLLALRTPDPVGGPDWGMRLLSTTRALGCVQIGRVVDGRLGVIGQDGAFADDGRFHELPPTVLEHANCAVQDVAGRTFLAVSVNGMPASVMPAACAVRPSPPLPRPLPKPTQAPPPLCAPEDVRIPRYGLLGPQARAITYKGHDGREVSVPTVGPQGAYLVVLAPDPRHPPTGQYTVASGPGSGLTSVRYRDGHVCKIRSPALIGGAKPCPPVGYREPRRAQVTDAQVAAPVHARLRDVGRDELRLDVSFKARLAVSSGRSSYHLWVTFPRSKSCSISAMGGPSPGNVAAR